MRYFLSGTLTLVVFFVAACAQGPATPVADQLSRGQVIYEQGCATAACHGIDGKGIRSGNTFRVWPLVGEEFQRRNPTAQVIFDIVRSGGESSLRALTDQQVYDSIAYELSLNEVAFVEPLDAQNAPDITSGAAAKKPEPGSLFPPPGNAELISNWKFPSLPASTENGDLRLRMTQIALADSIGSTIPPTGGSYVLIVFSLEVLADQPLEVGPQYLRLATTDGRMLEPVEIGLAYPVARFYPQTIQPEHGTTALAIFALPGSAKIDHLIYKLAEGQHLVLEMTSR